MSLVGTFQTQQGLMVNADAQAPAHSQAAPTEDKKNTDQSSRDLQAPQEGSSSQNAPTTTDTDELATETQAAAGSPTTKTDIANLRNNTLVTVTGQVTRVSEEDEFILTDSTGSVQIFTGGSLFAVKPGEIVTVIGLVDRSIILEVYANEIQHQDGTVTKVQHYG